MCGISGFYSSANNFSKDELVSMTDRMMHRGPDASGYFYEGFIGLGHRRLSIIDVSAAANQPMISHDNNHVIVFNGEIYNFQELKKELLAEKSIQFTTTSDTEVILEAFIHWGADFVQKLNGMFAMAIYNKATKTLTVFRDRIGIKPIYYFLDGQNFAFSSELKALTTISHIRKNLQINYTSVNEFLHLGYIPEPHSIYDHIFKFPAGNYAVINDSGVVFHKYWDLETKTNSDRFSDETDAKAKLKELLTSSINYRLICDVPFGTFLSGGIDSSLVTAIAQSLSTEPVKTFSIGFTESKYNESHYARAVADYLGTNHHEFVVTEKDALALIPELTDVYDEPYADSSAIPTMLVSKSARQHVTMTLSGDGGDELFMGYGAYKWAKRLNNPFLKTFHRHIYSDLSKLGNKYKRAAQLFDYQKVTDLKSHIFSQEQNLFKRQEIAAMLNPDFYRDFDLDEHYDGLDLSPAEGQSFFDLKYYLKDDLLVKVDRASMKYSLETRVPLLDYRIVEFAYNLPEKMKMKGNIQKHLLKEVLYDYIPFPFFDRPKWGFSIPLQKWLKTDLKYLIDDHLSEANIRKHQLVDYRFVADLKDRFFNKGQDYLYNRLWLLIVLNRFLDKIKP
ncbi:MAG TPA: asparagine synthase (glutamine-hydrolyzing) [Bacteroidales bacterium]|nr:asparagine synthase (glutamine-hydrolyzing) [Bacteroidales bacterium]